MTCWIPLSISSGSARDQCMWRTSRFVHGDFRSYHARYQSHLWLVGIFQVISICWVFQVNIHKLATFRFGKSLTSRMLRCENSHGIRGFPSLPCLIFRYLFFQFLKLQGTWWSILGGVHWGSQDPSNMFDELTQQASTMVTMGYVILWWCLMIVSLPQYEMITP